MKGRKTVYIKFHVLINHRNLFKPPTTPASQAYRQNSQVSVLGPNSLLFRRVRRVMVSEVEVGREGLQREGHLHIG